jgi:hypothetical protein
MKASDQLQAPAALSPKKKTGINLKRGLGGGGRLEVVWKLWRREQRCTSRDLKLVTYSS